jgi:hypothetical protein
MLEHAKLWTAGFLRSGTGPLLRAADIHKIPLAELVRFDNKGLIKILT